MRARIWVSFVVLLTCALVSPAASIAAAQAPAEQPAPAPAPPAEQPTPVPPAGQPAQPTPAAEATSAQAPPQQTLELSLDEAVKRALENNVDIAVARFNPELSAQSVRSAAGAFDPFVGGTFSHSSSDTRGISKLAGGAAVNTKTDIWNFTAGVPLESTGGTLSLSFQNSKTDTNNTNATVNPSFNSAPRLSLTQPLLQNLLIDSARQSLWIAKKNREISDVQFHATIVTSVAGVKSAYYDLIYAIDNLAAVQKSLDLARRLLNENQIRVKVGTMAPLDVVSAQSEVARNEASVIVAENAVGNAQDNLKVEIFGQNDPAMWATRIVPTDRPSAEPVPVDADGAVRVALANRTDVVAARKGLERSQISLRYARNLTLPAVNLTAAYGTSGVGGTVLVDNGTTIPGGYGDALSQAFARDFPTWNIGANVSYSIPNRSARAAAASAQISLRQAETSLRSLELSVAAEVRSAARAVESGWKSVQSTHAARVLQEQTLDAETKKFAAGMSTNYFVLQAQRDLASAEVAELQAIATYRKSIINLQRAQEAGLSGSGSSASLNLSSSTSAASRSSSASSTGQSSSGGPSAGSGGF